MFFNPGQFVIRQMLMTGQLYLLMDLFEQGICGTHLEFSDMRP
jgi:hypothetical protein